ncbi:MAG: condensation domain-containing protein, partial [Pyrinomonadaceae bacterium]
PEALIGHSLGEYVAASVAGVMELEEALALVAARGRLMQQVSGGAMLAVPLAEEELQPLLGKHLSVAAVNAPSMCILSGTSEAIDEVEKLLLERELDVRRLHVPLAAHSPLLTPIVEPFARFVEKITLRPPTIPYISNVTGTWITTEEATNPAYWARHLRQTVRFSDGIYELLKQKDLALLEVGPGRMLSTKVKQHPARTATHVVLSSVRHPQEKDSDVAFLQKSLGQLWLSGVPINWSKLYAHEQRRRVSLPTYPFERQRVWVEAAKPQEAATLHRNDAANYLDVDHSDNVTLISARHDAGSTNLVETERATFEQVIAPGSPRTRQDKIRAALESIITNLTGAEGADINPGASFFELGVDSLLLIQASQAIAKQFDIRLSLRQLLEKYSTLDTLAEYLDQQTLPQKFDAESFSLASQSEASQPQASPAQTPLNFTKHQRDEAARAGDERFATISDLKKMMANMLQDLSQQIETLRDNRSNNHSNGHHSNGHSGHEIGPLPASNESLTEPQIERPEHVAGKAELPASNGPQRFPLTEGQSQVWLASQITDHANIAYNESITLQMRGPFNYEALRKAVETVIARHEALRTTFSPQGEYQEVSSHRTIDIPLVDFSHLDESERREQVDEWLVKGGREPFDLARGPLMRVRVGKVEEDYHLLALTIHHIVMDGWSYGILLREIREIYSAECQGIAYELPEPELYSEYARRLADHEQSGEQEKAEAYWLEQFADSVPVLNLPADRPRAPVQTYRGERERLVLTGGIVGQLKALNAQHGCTSFVTLLTSFNILLGELTGEQDFVVGIHSAGQLSAGAKNLLGHWVNLLPLRAQVRRDHTFTQCLAQVKRKLLDAHTYQDYPLGRLIKKLNLRRDLSRPPLIAVTFNVDRAGAQASSFFGLEVSAAANHNGHSKFDMSVNIVEAMDTLLLMCDYNTDLFDARTIQHWLRHFELILKTVLERPEARLDEISEVIAEADRQQQSVKKDEFKNSRRLKLKNLKRQAVVESL